MTRGEAGSELTRVSDSVRRVQRGIAAWRGLTWLAGLVIGLSALAWAPAEWAAAPGSPLPMLALAAAVAVASGGGFAAGRSVANQALAVVAGEIETSAGLACGELTGALELESTRYGSRDLARLQRERVAAALSGRPQPELLPRSTARLLSARKIAAPTLGATSLLLLAGLGAGPVDKVVFVRPWSVTFPPPPPALVLEPANQTEVVRGETLTVRVLAVGRESVHLVWSVPGEPHRRIEARVAGGIAEVHVGPVLAPASTWAEDAAGQVSDSLRVEPVDPLMLTDLRIILTYPAHTGRGYEELSGTTAALTIPEGTRIVLRGRTNHAVDSAALTSRDDAEEVIAFKVEGGSLEAELFATRDARFAWTLVPGGPVPGVREPPDLDLSVVTDEGPEVAVVYPGADITLGIGQSLSLVVEARDDHGVTELDLVLWRETAAGFQNERTVVTGPPRTRQRRVSWNLWVDPESYGALPGDAIVYYAIAADANPRTPPARSVPYRVRLRTLAEMRTDVGQRVADLAEEASSLEERAERLAAASRDSERRVTGAAGDGTRQPESEASVDFESTEEARQVLRETRDLETAVEAAAEQIENLRRQIDGSPVPDRELQTNLERLTELYREILDSNLGEKIEALEQALHELDRREVGAALESIAKGAEALDRSLERALGLLERVALEQSLEGARARAGDLAQRQRRQEAKPSRGADWEDEQRRLSGLAEELSGDLGDLARRLGDSGATDPAGLTRAAASDVSAATQEMKPDGGPADGRTQAGSEGDGAGSAADRLDRATERLEDAARSLARDWKEEAIDAVDRAMSEALQLASEQADIAEDLAAGRESAGADGVAGRQASVREGLDNLTQALADAGKKSALLDRRSGPAASRAAEDMDAAVRSLADGSLGRRDAAGKAEAAAAALGDLAGALVASRQAMAEATSGTGMEEALGRLAEIGQKQAGLNGETGELFLLPAGDGAAEGRLRDLGARQAELSRQLEQLAAHPAAADLAGRPDEIAREADEIARQLTAGELDRSLLTRQEQLFRSLLDAGRTLRRDDEDPRRRESTAARPVGAATPTEIDPAVLAGPRYPYPVEAELEGLTSMERRLVYEYFDRLNQGSAPQGSQR